MFKSCREYWAANYNSYLSIWPGCGWYIKPKQVVSSKLVGDFSSGIIEDCRCTVPLSASAPLQWASCGWEGLGVARLSLRGLVERLSVGCGCSRGGTFIWVTDVRYIHNAQLYVLVIRLRYTDLSTSWCDNSIKGIKSNISPDSTWRLSQPSIYL